MTTTDQELTSSQEGFGQQEAGVGDLMELYERIEAIYVGASTAEDWAIQTSDSTNGARVDANLGRDSSGTQ